MFSARDAFPPEDDMLKKLMALPLALILILATPGRVSYAQPQSTAAQHTARVKAEIGRRGKGSKARVMIKLKGRIDQTNGRSFTLIDEKTGKSANVEYREVQNVSSRGLNKSKKIGIIASLAVGVVVLVGVLSFMNFHPFEHGVLR
jgi:hypothetical protein